MVDTIFFGKIKYETTSISLKNKKFKVEIADSFRKVAVGLMDHKSLPAGGGMLFVFKSDGRHGFWMLNMKFSIDIIWIDDKFRVVHILENAQPCESIFSCSTETPPTDSRYVVEIRAGMTKKLKLKLGDRISMRGI